jgi:hypothetical protein
MPSNPSQKRKSMSVLQVLALLFCLTLAVAIPAATDCKTYKLEVPDPASLKLRDGEHTIASMATDHGRFEARVTVKNEVASEPHYYIGGKLLKETPESEIPANLRDCLNKERKTSSISGDRIEKAVPASRGRIMPASYVPDPIRTCFTVAGCNEAPGDYAGRIECCATAVCYFKDGSRSQTSYCGLYPASTYQ